MGGYFQFFKDRKSVILGVWVAPGARETIPLGGGLRPPPFGRVSMAPGAAQTPPNIGVFRSLFFLNSIATQSAATCFRAGDRPSGPDFGRTATGKEPKSALRPAEGRPEDRFRCFPGSSPAKIRPGRQIYGPEALLRDIQYGFRILAKRVLDLASMLLGLASFC